MSPERGAIVLLISMLAACGHVRTKQVIVLGVDGMDPGFVEAHWADLPNLAKLRDSGAFSRLATTTPPQSPVAWSTFATGLDPAEHGIFDFVHRDPATGAPFLSTDKTEAPRFRIPVGPYEIPLSGSKVVSLRHGKAFWETLAENGVPVTVIRMPANYPPVRAGKELSGMGTPDLRGTQGTFTLFTDDPDEVSRDVSGGMIRKVNSPDLLVEGPPNPLRSDRRVATATLTVHVDPDQPYARLQSGDSDALIREGEWSEWISLSFPLLPHLATASGMVRVYAKQLHPHLQLYVSPVHSYDFPISQPKSFAQAIAAEIGMYNTLGIPEDTAALRQGVFNMNEFLSQTQLVLADERRMLTYSLNHFEDGFLFFYFSSIDQNSHMLWGKHDDELLKFYRAIDECVGETRARFPDADLMVMSDHGFTTFDRAVHLNRWLANRGLAGHAIGLNALYGKDPAIRSQLMAWRDPANGHAVVLSVEQVEPARENKAIAPDLIVGYAPGYRASWQTGQGETPELELEDNNDAWIADHCIDAAYVPGVLFTSWKNGPRGRSLKDLSRTILGLFAARHTEN